ncbi:MAG: hypothetical protein ACTSSM_16025 [Promethearchaeota archaeon]
MGGLSPGHMAFTIAPVAIKKIKIAMYNVRLFVGKTFNATSIHLTIHSPIGDTIGFKNVKISPIT